MYIYPRSLFNQDIYIFLEYKFKRVVNELTEDAVLLREHKQFLRMLGLPEADIENLVFGGNLSLKEIVWSGMYEWRGKNSSEGIITKIVQCLEKTGHKRLAG
jgi:hypothetical protein